MSSENPVVLLVTAGTRDEAERLGEGLLEAGLGSRGSVIPGIHSFWLEEGGVKRGHEALLVFTTTDLQEPAVRAFVEANHSFQEHHVLSLRAGAIS